VELYNAATGRALMRDGLFKAAERLVTLERCIDAREGISRQEDTLPTRFFQPFDTGKNRGKALDVKKMEEMKSTYYQLRGWDSETGLPTEDTLVDLNLEDIVENKELWNENRLRKTG